VQSTALSPEFRNSTCGFIQADYRNAASKGDFMKKLFTISAALCSLLSVPAYAASNSSPHALDCMAKNGFTHDMWVAKRAGTNAQVQSYIACRDGVSLKRARDIGKNDGNFDTWNPKKH
jgi:hypothetical protein